MVVQDAVRYGPGADVLPVIDAIDELEPLVACLVARNAAMVLAVSLGAIVYKGRVSSEVPRRTRAGSSTFWPGMDGHQDELWQRHLRHVAKVLDAVIERHPTQRVYLAGPTEQVSALRGVLRRQTRGLVRGVVKLPSRAPMATLRDAALRASEEDERRLEQEKVQALVTRAQKDQHAALGALVTFHALRERRVHQLVAASAARAPGRRCPLCGHVGPVEQRLCPSCGAATGPVDLIRELVILAVRAGVSVEVVHGEAASGLAAYGSVGAFLRTNKR
jgi:hypothetical protein